MKMPTAVFRRPWLHHVIIIGYIVAPFANILLLRLFLNRSLRVVLSGLFSAYGVLAMVWLVTAPIVGICLYFVSRLSWYLFLGHSSLILIDFIVKWASRPAYYLRTIPGVQNLLILVGNIALVGFVTFILQRDFRAPYFQVLNRGWRERKRVPINYPVDVGGQALVASDLSTSGCFVVDRDANRAPGSRLRLSLPVDSSKIDCTGEVMRTTSEGLGIRFLDLTTGQKHVLDRMLKKRVTLDRKVAVPGSPATVRY